MLKRGEANRYPKSRHFGVNKRALRFMGYDLPDSHRSLGCGETIYGRLFGCGETKLLSDEVCARRNGRKGKNLRHRQRLKIVVMETMMTMMMRTRRTCHLHVGNKTTICRRRRFLRIDEYATTQATTTPRRRK